jgi:hypothetical protein
VIFIAPLSSEYERIEQARGHPQSGMRSSR